jgi:L-fuculose-phosphate aldolase
MFNNEELLREQLINTGILLLDKGLVAGTWGNISVRIPETKHILITPSGRNYRELSRDDLAKIDQNGDFFSGNYKPSSELPLHLAVYQARPDIQSIVHTHSTFASALAVARKGIPPIIEDLVQLAGGSIEVSQYALPGTSELARNTVTALGQKNAVLLANHGVLGCGQSLQEAMTACELVEKAAQIYLYAEQLGGAHILSDKDVTVMHEFYINYYRQRQK